MNFSKKTTLVSIFFTTIIALGILARFYHIEFGLPQSFFADEPEFSELAIKYTYEFKDIISKNNYYKLIPISYVYGTFPSYFLTLALMLFSKSLNLLNIPFDKTTLFVFLRVFCAIIGLLTIPFTGLLAKKIITNDNKSITIGLFSAALVAINWKIIVHSHYVNADLILCWLNLISVYFLIVYLQTQTTQIKKKWIFYISAIFYGIAVGTKITALITAPLLFIVFVRRKTLYEMLSYFFTALIAFIISNPFSIIYFNDFSYRILSMLTKEGGMVFDSVDYSYTKYISGLILMLTGPILVMGIAGIVIYLLNNKSFKKIQITDEFILLIGTVIIYFAFYTIQSRRVDRWLLPTLPIFIIFAEVCWNKFTQKLAPLILIAAFFVINLGGFYYLYILANQFQKDTPKSAAYTWMKNNTGPLETKLVYTEEGLDPMNKLPSAKVEKYNVYSTENAQFFLPRNPLLYDYVVLSSRPMENFNKAAVKNAYPRYAEEWNTFLQTVQDPKQFELIKDFTLIKPNLIPLSDVYIYKKIQTPVK